MTPIGNTGPIGLDGSRSIRVASSAGTFYAFDPETGAATDGLQGQGIAVMAIDNLPCELSQDASEHFSSVLVNHIPDLMQLDMNASFEDLALNPEVKDAIIVYQGQLTPDFAYLADYLS